MKSLLVGIVLLLVALFAVLSTTHRAQSPTDNLPIASPANAETQSQKERQPTGNPPLRIVSDVPMNGGATRFDYQSLDSNNGRLYIAHLGDGMMTVFDTNKQTIVGDVKGLSRVHGVLAVSELHRVLASATGANELAVIDDQTLQVVSRVPAGDYPDGVAYASKVKRFMSRIYTARLTL